MKIWYFNLIIKYKDQLQSVKLYSNKTESRKFMRKNVLESSIESNVLAENIKSEYCISTVNSKFNTVIGTL